MSWLVVVTGRPAAGKSTLATWLGKQLAFPVISKDAIKEILFNQLGGQVLQVDTTNLAALRYGGILGQVVAIMESVS